MKYSKLCEGFSLLEVLIALLITAIGLLGISGFVLHSMRASFESELQTTAALLAVDVHERAWIDSHLPATEDTVCSQDWVDLQTFAPGLDLAAVGLRARVETPEGTTYVNDRECLFSVQWDGASSGVVGQMAEFGGMYTHRFLIPSVQ